MTQEQLPLVAVPSMNDTHLEELLIINKLDSAATSGDLQTLSETLTALLEHTIEHFSNENKMMQEAHFPAFETHKSEHDRHLHELQSVIKYFKANQDPSAITAYIYGTLIPWLIHHIQTMDSMTALFLQQKNS